MEKLTFTQNFEKKEGELELSKKLKNRLTEILKQFCEQNLIKNVLNSVKLENYDIHQQAEINSSLPEILTALLNKENGLISIEINDLKDIIGLIAKKIISKESFNDIVLSIGMGGSINTPNVRTPAYIVSAIKTLKSFQELNDKGLIEGLPKVRIFKANNLSSTLNQFDLSQVTKTTDITFDFLKAFILKFFPNLENQFEFIIDQPTSDELIQDFQSQADLLLTIEHIRDEITNVLKMGEKHGGDHGKNNALIYATAHPFYGGSIVRKGKQAPKIIIDFGGKPQERFNGISRQLINANKTSEEYDTIPTIHAIVKSGKVPVYYTARDGDLPISGNFNGINLKTLDRATHIDYKEIFSLVNQEDFEQFTRDFVTQNQEKIQQLEK